MDVSYSTLFGPESVFAELGIGPEFRWSRNRNWLGMGCSWVRARWWFLSSPQKSSVLLPVLKHTFISAQFTAWTVAHHYQLNYTVDQTTEWTPTNTVTFLMKCTSKVVQNSTCIYSTLSNGRTWNWGCTNRKWLGIVGPGLGIDPGWWPLE